MLISFAYRLTRKVLSAVATLALRDVSGNAELLVLRHENAVLHRIRFYGWTGGVWGR